MKVLKEYRSEQEAAIESLVLKDLGIPFQIAKVDGGPFPSLSDIYGYSIQVNDDDYERAVEGLPQNINLPDEATTPSGVPESENSQSASVDKKWYLFVGIIFGIILGLFGNWLFLTLKFHVSEFPKITYSGGLASRIIEDKNNDKKADLWQNWDGNGYLHSRQDCNFDGEPDYWFKELDGNNSEDIFDSDFNGIPDVTAYYWYNVLSYRYFHPNNQKKITKYEIYSASGVLEKQYFDTDSVSGVDRIKYYDVFENVIKEDTIKDSMRVSDKLCKQ